MEYRKSLLIKGAILFLVLFMLSGCSQGFILIEGKSAKVYENRYEQRHVKPPSIPPGHLPPPGSCRIWFQGTPPGHQPPAGDCHQLSKRVPPGAWLIWG